MVVPQKYEEAKSERPDKVFLKPKDSPKQPGDSGDIPRKDPNEDSDALPSVDDSDPPPLVNNNIRLTDCLEQDSHFRKPYQHEDSRGPNGNTYVFLYKKTIRVCFGYRPTEKDSLIGLLYTQKTSDYNDSISKLKNQD